MPEFVKGMKECKVCDLGDKALKHLFRFFDKDDSGAPPSLYYVY
jgi:Ca2+-binding EF-hand superfamily protein